MQFACVEKLSLHRVRDSMGLGLEPVLGLLRYPISPILCPRITLNTRVTKNLLHLIDPDYANVLQQCVSLSFEGSMTSLAYLSQGVLLCHSTRYLIC